MADTRVETVRIEHEGFENGYVINAVDFDSVTMKLFREKAPSEVRAKTLEVEKK